MVSARVAPPPFEAPPVLEAIDREPRGVVGGADEQGAAVGLQVVHAVGDGDGVGIGAEVVVVDEHGFAVPLGALIFEGSDEFLLLRVDADERQVLGGAVLSQLSDPGELRISVWVRTARELLVVDPK